MSEAVDELVGVRVKVWSMGTVTEDTGILEACDDTWVRLRKDDGRAFCFPVANVRLIEPVAVPNRDRHLASL